MVMGETQEDHSAFHKSKFKKPENKNAPGMPSSDLWTDGLICAFELVRGPKKHTSPTSGARLLNTQLDGENLNMQLPENRLTETSSPGADRKRLLHSMDELKGAPKSSNVSKDGHMVQPESTHRYEGSHWVPIGWVRISELVHKEKENMITDWGSHPLVDSLDDEEDISVAEVAAPYWESPGGPTWWCHVEAGHSSVDNWLCNAQWLHPAISLALRYENRLISERMKHLLYEVPVRVAGGLLFELLGQSAGDPLVNEDDVPIVLRSWQAKNFLITVMHVKGKVSTFTVLGITEVQELLFAGGYNVPRTVHEIIALLACRLARWDDRLFRKSIFGAADEIELKFVNRRNHEDMNLFSIILNQEIRKLSTQVIRVKWSLHAREEIVFELLQHLRGSAARVLLEGIVKSSRQMIEEQEAVRGRLFTIQDVMQSNMRAWLQDKSLRVTHNLGVFGGCGLVLSIITGLFGINVDGIPGSENTPYAFALFTGILLVIGAVLIAVGMIYLGLKRPIKEEEVEVRKLEMDELVKMFQHEAESHAQVRKNNLSPTAGDIFDANYVLIQ